MHHSRDMMNTHGLRNRKHRTETGDTVNTKNRASRRSKTAVSGNRKIANTLMTEPGRGNMTIRECHKRGIDVDTTADHEK